MNVRVVVALVALALAAVALAAGCGSHSGDTNAGNATAKADEPEFPVDLPRPQFDTATIEVGDVELTAEIADSADERAYGCMFMRELREDRGMLFLFRDSEMHSFWMRNTRIPLDIAYLSASGRVVTLHRNAKPFCETPQAYASSEATQFVLEVAGGWFERHGLDVGALVWIPHEVLTRTPDPDTYKPNLPRRIGP